MISASEAQKHTLRMSGLRNFPQQQAGIDELANAIMRASRNSNHAQRIAKSVIDCSTFCPVPAEIYEIGGRTYEDDTPKNYHCGVCGGTSWEPIYELVTWNGQKRHVERITKERYEFLLPKVSGQTGDQLVHQATIRCTHCKLGRDRALAEETEAHQ